MSNSKPKQVWLLNHYAQEPGNAGGTRHHSIAKQLVELDWNATIVAASVETVTGRQRLPRGQSTKMAVYDGVPFLWIRTPKYNGNGLGRLWNMLVYSCYLLIPSVTRELPRPDVIVGSSVHPLAAWSAACLASRWRVPFVFEVRDLWPQTLVDFGRLKEHSVAATLLRWLEKWLYRRANRIIVLLPDASDYIVPLGVPKSKITWIPNGVEIERGTEPAASKDEEYFTFMYFGAHGSANGLGNVLRAMKEIERDPAKSKIRLRLIGDGPSKATLQELAETLHLDCVSFENPVPKTDIPYYAAQADAFVFSLVDAPVFNYGISSNKLFDFLAAARPIVFCCNASNNPVEMAGAGISVLPGDPQELASAMIRLAEMPLTERVQMGRAGREFVCQRHNFRVLAKQFSHVLNDATNSDGASSL